MQNILMNSVLCAFFLLWLIAEYNIFLYSPKW